MIAKVQPQHQRDRLRRKNNIKIKNEKDDDDVKIEFEIMKVQSQHPRDRLRRKIKNQSKKIDVKSLTEEPFVEINLNISSLERQKRENVIFDQIMKNLPSDNNTFYIEHNKENSTFVVEEDKEKDEMIRNLETVEAKLKSTKRKKQSKKQKTKHI